MVIVHPMARGVIAASDPRVARAGADVLASGGNAVDAAVAAVLVLFVVEPHACGPGGDAFLLFAEPGGDVKALDGSGAVPAGLTSAALAADGLDNVPVRRGRAVTVPGAMGLLEEALRRHGTRTMAELVGPALALAREGFEARRTLAETSARAATEISKDPVLGPLYAPGGIPLKIGQVVRNRVLGNLLERLASEGADEFYRGSIAEAIVARVQDDGGYLSLGDMAAYTTLPVQPQSAMFRGAACGSCPCPPRVLQSSPRSLSSSPRIPRTTTSSSGRSATGCESAESTSTAAPASLRPRRDRRTRPISQSSTARAAWRR